MPLHAQTARERHPQAQDREGYYSAFEEPPLPAAGPAAAPPADDENGTGVLAPALEARLEASHDDVRLMSAAWEVSWDEVELGKELARGAQGAVFRGTMRGKWDVARLSRSIGINRCPD